MDDRVKLEDWFDVKNREHLQAYSYHMQNGKWPQHFIPADVEVVDAGQSIGLWKINLMNKIVTEFMADHNKPVTRTSTRTVSIACPHCGKLNCNC